MKINDILLERFINLVTPAQRKPYALQVWHMINDTYEQHTSGLGPVSPEDLILTPGVWKVAVRNGQVKGGAVYRNFKGRKLRLVFHDGTPEGKEEMKKIMRDDITHGRAWGEFSGALEKVMLRFGGKPVPNEYAERILGKPIIKYDQDGFHYWRNVGGGNVKREIIIGNPTV